MTSATIESILQNLPNLPVPVRSWRVEMGPDATEESAVWVWATLDDENADRNTRARLRDLVKEAVSKVPNTLSPWVYVRFRALSETDED